MAEISCFFRNRCTGVEQVDQETMRAFCRLQDTRMEAFVEIAVKLPGLEITHARGEILRSVRELERDAPESLGNAVGVRVGPGLKKILQGVIGDSPLRRELTFMLEECCGAVILAFTKDVLSQAPKDRSKEREYFENFVRANIRLYNSCAAFAPGSPLVEGIDPPGRSSP